MRRRAATLFALTVVCAAAFAGCGSTGGEIVDFEAFAAGPEGITAGEPYVFETDRGYTVTLTKATLHIGAVYLNNSVPTSVDSDTSCYLASLYVAEVTEGFTVDVLDPELQPFPARGFASSEKARTAEIWLSGGEIEADVDTTIVASIEGEAERGGDLFPFSGTVTISENRRLDPIDPAQPGSRPMCKQRIVSPIRVDITPSAGGALVVRVDPAGWFSNVEFEDLEASGNPPAYEFQDNSDDQPSRNLFNGIRASAGVYDVSWID